MTMNNASNPAYTPLPLAVRWAKVSAGMVMPRIVIGDFLDDWRRAADSTGRAALIVDAILDSEDPVIHRWSAFASAMVEHLARRDGVPVPSWVGSSQWVLPEPWFLNPYWKLRIWQLVVTPPAFKRRRIFGGDEATLIGRV